MSVKVKLLVMGYDANGDVHELVLGTREPGDQVVELLRYLLPDGSFIGTLVGKGDCNFLSKESVNLANMKFVKEPKKICNNCLDSARVEVTVVGNESNDEYTIKLPTSGSVVDTCHGKGMSLAEVETACRKKAADLAKDAMKAFQANAAKKQKLNAQQELNEAQAAQPNADDDQWEKTDDEQAVIKKFGKELLAAVANISDVDEMKKKIKELTGN